MTDKIFALAIYIDYNGLNFYPQKICIRIVFDYSSDGSSSETQGQSVESGEN